MPAECSPPRMQFARLGGRAMVADFGGSVMTSDAGALLLGARDRAIGVKSEQCWIIWFLLIHEAQQGCRDATYEPSRFPVAVPYPSPHRATPGYVVVTSSDLDTSRNKASVSGLSWISRIWFGVQELRFFHRGRSRPRIPG